MTFRDKLKVIFYHVAGSNFSDPRRCFYEAKARDSFNTAMALLNGKTLPPNSFDKVKAFLNRKYESGRPVSLKGPELAIKYFREAQKRLEKTERLPTPAYYHEVFGISKAEFELEILEAKFQIKHPEFLKQTKKNDHEFHP